MTIEQTIRRNILSPAEAMEEIFENSISSFKMYEMLRNGKIPSFKVGSRYFLRRETVEKWMQDQENM